MMKQVEDRIALSKSEWLRMQEIATAVTQLLKFEEIAELYGAEGVEGCMNSSAISAAVKQAVEREKVALREKVAHAAALQHELDVVTAQKDRLQFLLDKAEHDKQKGKEVKEPKEPKEQKLATDAGKAKTFAAFTQQFQSNASK